MEAPTTARERIASHALTVQGRSDDQPTEDCDTNCWEFTDSRGRERTLYLATAERITARQETKTWFLEVSGEFAVPVTFCPCCGEKLPDIT